ncbi:Cinnamoyl-CoA reductase 2 [Vitis vinifera]|uniref:Cinnamoyl-CoA reductase 2 n=1 Tax=Vitis vinifera TaxID=29760 RepID=A0A438JA41_VITVI|nr:Cinnamoyl-CoA reductase 2 [Vitis vinifera]
MIKNNLNVLTLDRAGVDEWDLEEGELKGSQEVIINGRSQWLHWVLVGSDPGGAWLHHHPRLHLPRLRPSHLFSLPGAAAADIVVYEADLLDAEAVARAVEGCTGVFHVASPCSLEDPKDPEKELLMPAVEGTKNVLEAARRFQVRRVVLTSSISALVPNPSWPPNIPFNETSWTDLHYCKSRQVFSFSSLLR